MKAIAFRHLQCSKQAMTGGLYSLLHYYIVNAVYSTCLLHYYIENAVVGVVLFCVNYKVLSSVFYYLLIMKRE